MRTSDDGVAFITKHEGVRLTTYKDVAGYPTIGVGHLILEGEVFDEPLSAQAVFDLLRKDLVVAEDAVLKNVKVELKQHEFDALVSFVFNVGAGAFASSTLLKLLNGEDRDGAAKQFLRWNKAGGKEVAGLSKRRDKERLLFLSGKYSA